jgi:LPXTG-motif cell wall-anchored protein
MKRGMNMRRKICSLLLILALVCAMALPVSAHEVPDADRLGSISIAMTHQGEPVPGGTLTLYQVADVVSNDGDYLFRYTADFAECTIPVTELSSADLPRELAGIAQTRKLQGATLTVDVNGKVKFSDLQIGLYLLVQTERMDGFYPILPILLQIPQEGVWDQHLHRQPAPVVTEIPKTGQSPAPFLGVLGMVLSSAGLLLCREKRRK